MLPAAGAKRERETVRAVDSGLALSTSSSAVLSMESCVNRDSVHALLLGLGGRLIGLGACDEGRSELAAVEVDVSSPVMVPVGVPSLDRFSVESLFSTIGLAVVLVVVLVAVSSLVARSALSGIVGCSFLLFAGPVPFRGTKLRRFVTKLMFSPTRQLITILRRCLLPSIPTTRV